MSTTLRVSEATRSHAASLAAATGQSIGAVVEQSLIEYERAAFWSQTAAALAARQTPEPDGDAPLWDRTLRDGLDRD